MFSIPEQYGYRNAHIVTRHLFQNQDTLVVNKPFMEIYDIFLKIEWKKVASDFAYSSLLFSRNYKKEINFYLRRWPRIHNGWNSKCPILPLFSIHHQIILNLSFITAIFPSVVVLPDGYNNSSLSKKSTKG